MDNDLRESIAEQLNDLCGDEPEEFDAMLYCPPGVNRIEFDTLVREVAAEMGIDIVAIAECVDGTNFV